MKSSIIFTLLMVKFFSFSNPAYAGGGGNMQHLAYQCHFSDKVINVTQNDDYFKGSRAWAYPYSDATSLRYRYGGLQKDSTGTTNHVFCFGNNADRCELRIFIPQGQINKRETVIGQRLGEEVNCTGVGFMDLRE